MSKRRKEITNLARQRAEEQIRLKQQEVKYDLRDFTVAFIVQQFRDDFFYIPDYQREYIWTQKNRCRFIESVILGLPIPMMFVADMEDGRLEIVDGAQRIQTLEAFLNEDLQLSDLDQLPQLNGFTHADLPDAQKRKFGNKALRLVVLDDMTSPETRQEIFNRVNSSGVRARPSEIRRGSFTGPLMRLVAELSNDKQFRRLCPISKKLLDRREGEELVLRFFAYSENYQDFTHNVDKFLDKFAKDHRDNLDDGRFREEFSRVLDFVESHFPNGFAKSSTANSTPRVRFEALAVGVNLALRENPNLVPTEVGQWLNSDEFIKHTTTHASNSGPRLRGRIEFVRDMLLRDSD